MVLLSLAASHHDLDLDVLERLSSDVQAVASEQALAASGTAAGNFDRREHITVTHQPGHGDVLSVGRGGSCDA